MSKEDSSIKRLTDELFTLGELRSALEAAFYRAHDLRSEGLVPAFGPIGSTARSEFLKPINDVIRVVHDELGALLVKEALDA